MSSSRFPVGFVIGVGALCGAGGVFIKRGSSVVVGKGGLFIVSSIREESIILLGVCFFPGRDR